MITQLNIAGMTCAHCVQTVEDILRARPGVTHVVVSLADGAAEIEHDAEQSSPDQLVNAVEEEGYDVTALQG